MTGRHLFHEELDKLHHDLLKMGSLVAEAIYNSVKSLKEQDIDLAESIIAGDDIIDQMHIDIENRCFRLIALQQPMGIDLRRIGTMLKIVTDLERMGDHANSIAKTTVRLKGEKYVKPLIDIPKMAELVQKMVHDALDAYINQDVDKAYEVAKRDDQIDKLYSIIFKDVVDIMTNDSSTIRQVTHLLFVAQYLERVADHVTNLSEWIIYMVTGKLTELNN